jgi:hypothetical protein
MELDQSGYGGGTVGTSWVDVDDLEGLVVLSSLVPIEISLETPCFWCTKQNNLWSRIDICSGLKINLNSYWILKCKLQVIKNTLIK